MKMLRKMLCVLSFTIVSTTQPMDDENKKSTIDMTVLEESLKDAEKNLRVAFKQLSTLLENNANVPEKLIKSFAKGEVTIGQKQQLSHNLIGLLDAKLHLSREQMAKTIDVIYWQFMLDGLITAKIYDNKIYDKTEQRNQIAGMLSAVNNKFYCHEDCGRADVFERTICQDIRSKANSDIREIIRGLANKHDIKIPNEINHNYIRIELEKARIAHMNDQIPCAYDIQYWDLKSKVFWWVNAGSAKKHGSGAIKGMISALFFELSVANFDRKIYKQISKETMQLIRHVQKNAGISNEELQKCFQTVKEKYSLLDSDSPETVEKKKFVQEKIEKEMGKISKEGKK